MPGVHREQGDAQRRHTRCELLNELRCGQTAHISLQHPPLAGAGGGYAALARETRSARGTFR
jgi:hypothetical protein